MNAGGRNIQANCLISNAHSKTRGCGFLMEVQKLAPSRALLMI